MAKLPPVATLEELPEVMTDKDLCRLLQLGRYQFEQLLARERQTRREVLPPRIVVAGLKKRRYLRDDVKVWLRNGGASHRPRRIA